jgi:phage gp29-like protein
MKIIKKSTLVDRHGQPIEYEALTTTMADAQLTGMRNIWAHGSVASSLTPMRLAAVLQNAANGDHHEFLTLAEEMEERDPHYASVLGTRKRAASGIDHEIESATDAPNDVRIADDVRAMLARHDIGTLIEDMLDGLGKGYSCIEILWDMSERQWSPAGFDWRDPRFFTLDRVTGRQLLLLTDASPFGEPLKPFKFITHLPRVKSGLPVRSALARLSATSYMCKSWALSDWMTFAEIFGMPIRVGKYHSNATAEEKNTLRMAVANLGSDAAAIMPDSMKIEFHEGGKGSGGNDLFERLCIFLDKQVSKGVLGQTMTADDGSSQAQAKVHNEVRIDILSADAKQLEAAINQQLIRPYVDLNHGPQTAYPRLRLPVAEPEDIDSLVTAVEKLVPLGLKVSQKHMRSKLAIPDPGKDDELLGSPKSDTAPALNHQTALNRDTSGSSDDIDALADDMIDWEPQMTGLVNPIQQLLDECESPEEFADRLPELMARMDNTAVIDGLADAFFQSRAIGNADI